MEASGYTVDVTRTVFGWVWTGYGHGSVIGNPKPFESRVAAEANAAWFIEQLAGA